MTHASDDPATKSGMDQLLRETARISAPAAAESPSAGTTEVSVEVGTQTDTFGAVRADTGPVRDREHLPGGMLNGASVVVRSSSAAHGVTHTRGRILDIASVPAAHIVLEHQDGAGTGRWIKRIIFCSAIEWIDEVS